MEWVLEHSSVIMNLILIAASIASFFFVLKQEIASLKSDVTYIKDNQRNQTEAIKQLSGILTKIAVQDTRLNMIEKNIDELKHGQGFIRIKNAQT